MTAVVTKLWNLPDLRALLLFVWFVFPYMHPEITFTIQSGISENNISSSYMVTFKTQLCKQLILAQGHAHLLYTVPHSQSTKCADQPLLIPSIFNLAFLLQNSYKIHDASKYKYAADLTAARKFWLIVAIAFPPVDGWPLSLSHKGRNE